MQKQCDKMYNLLGNPLEEPGPGGQMVPQEVELFGRTYHKFKWVLRCRLLSTCNLRARGFALTTFLSS